MPKSSRNRNTSDVALLKHWSNELCALLRKMLSKDPTQRLTMAQLMKHRWLQANNWTRLNPLKYGFCWSMSVPTHICYFYLSLTLQFPLLLSLSLTSMPRTTNFLSSWPWTILQHYSFLASMWSLQCLQQLNERNVLLSKFGCIFLFKETSEPESVPNWLDWRQNCSWRRPVIE